MGQRPSSGFTEVQRSGLTPHDFDLCSRGADCGCSCSIIHSLKPPCSGVVEHWKASTLGGVCESSLEKVSRSYRYRSREGGNDERIILESLGALWLADARNTALAPGSDGAGGTRRDARAPEMRDADRGALLLVPPEVPDAPQE